MCRSFCVVVFVSYLCLTSVYSEETPKVDYRKLEHVLWLSNDTFDSNVGTGRWFVIFYRSSCGGCKRYFPKFSDIVDSITSWPRLNPSEPPVNLASVDCESPEGSPVCLRHSITGVPNLRFFSGDVEVRKQYPSGIRITHDTNVTVVLRELVANLLKEVKLVHESKTEHPIGITVESNSELENTLIILEFQRKLQRPMTSHINPSMTQVVLRSPNGAVIVSGSPERVRQELIGDDKSYTTSEMTTLAYNRESLYVTETPVYAVDIFRGLSAIFESDMPMFPVINGEERAAVLEFLSVLIKLLPASQFYREKLFELHSWVSERESFSGKDWLNTLNDIKFPLSRDDYKGCKGSSITYRGYSCSLWTIFHALTVSQCERKTANEELKPTAVLHAMNRFIPRFFSCLECAYHFALNSRVLVGEHETAIPTNREFPNTAEFTDYTPLESLPPIPQNCYEQVLWLNAAHNGVNQRLAGQNTEDPKAPKVIYPPRSVCPKCWHQVDGEADKWVLGNTPDTKAALTEFLMKHYSSANWVLGNINPDFITLKDVTKFEPENSDFLVIALISAVLTVVALVALIFVTRALWRCKSRKGSYTAAHTV